MSANAILRLQTVGFSTEQVAALADLVDSQAAGKADLVEIEHRLKGHVDAAEQRVTKRIDEIEHRVDLQIADIKSTQPLHNWMLVSLLALQIAIFIKLFVH